MVNYFDIEKDHNFIFVILNIESKDNYWNRFIFYHYGFSIKSISLSFVYFH